MNLASPTPTPLPALRDIVPPQAYHLPGDYLWLALGLAAVGAAAYLAWRWLRAPRKPGPPPSARAVAEARLRELRARAPDLEARVFGAEVCAIITVYIGSIYGLAPEHQTSGEFLQALAGQRVLSPAQHAALEGFLTRCDLLKYARLDAEPEAKEGLLAQASEFIHTAGPETASLAPEGVPA